MCGRTKYGIWNGPGNLSGHNDVGLTEFSVEKFYRRMFHTVRNWSGGTSMMELRDNRALLLDGGCEVQINFIIKNRSIRVIYLRISLCRRGVSL